MKAYADTSFLISLYTPDANSARAAAQMSRGSTVFLVTPFGEVEITNALELRVFRKEIRRVEAEAAYHAFQGDIRSEVLSLRPLPSAVYEKARQLARKHTAALGVRTLDILHVAAALVLRAEVFYTCDASRRKLARVAGLTTY
ncbi:MAG: type II toxin-antitoxin system VapC family toxin [Acidobacteria bacterium]|nr:type II toxin-antitoxin system VapC family toxin [Acidobacteriota bacterium]